MRRAIRPTVAALAAFGLLVTGAVARMAPTKGSPETTHYRGTDPAGAVTFKVHDLYAGNGPVYIYDLKFADGCGTTGMSVMSVSSHIRVGRSHHFTYMAHGVAIRGQISKKLTNSGGATFVHYPKVKGTVIVENAICESNLLAFSATEGKTGSKP
jgi:hypothetical protein